MRAKSISGLFKQVQESAIYEEKEDDEAPKPEVRALRTTQGEGVSVYAFFIPGAEIIRIADISRVERDVSESLKGFQRREIKTTLKPLCSFWTKGRSYSRTRLLWRFHLR